MPFLGFGKRKHRNRVITLHLDNTYDERMRECEGGEIHGYGKKANKTFTPKAVFEPRGRGKKLILVGERCKSAYTFNPNDKGLEKYWTEQEAIEVVDKETALSLQKLKPIEWNIAIILIIMLAVTIILQIIMVSKMRLF